MKENTMETLDRFKDIWLAMPESPWQGPVPLPDLDSAAFWAGTNRHQLLVARCHDCGYWVHPPLAGCPQCLSVNMSPQEVSGNGTLYSYTVVNREFAPGIEPPYVAALVDLDEQENLRLLTNLVNVRIGDISIGMRLSARFHDIGGQTLVLFEPVREMA